MMSVKKIIDFPGSGTKPPSGQEPPMSTEYVTKPEFDLAINRLDNHIEKCATKEALAKVESDVAVIKATMATKAELSEAKASIIMWVVSAIFIAQLLPLVKDWVSQSKTPTQSIIQPTPLQK